ncbi:sensor histidine kinase [Alteromonas facilis]|uniref:sensor histidine kinase n=1 Tax=Alteromonas facilis TaxID=2048004 RepID=UPI0013D9A68E|nr:HAMP domain-containing sensor histidine kinase [Alteromonas facilis]
MSLQRYLFLLIAGIVLLVAAVQMTFIHLIREQVSEEVSTRSQAVTDFALSFVTQTGPLTDNVTSQPREVDGTVEIRIEKAPNVPVDLGDGIQFVTGDSTKIVHVSQLPDALPVTGFNLKRVGNAYGVSVQSADNTQSIQHIMQFDDSESRVNIYFTGLMAVTLVLALMGLALGYWLARHISRPLHQLANGFDRVAQGELGSQVKEAGVGEVKYTIRHFNTMSDRLRDSHKMEQQLQQRNHLAELGEVARGLAHSLRNPLNTIGLTVEQMQQSDLTEKEKNELALQAKDKIQVMDNYIRHLLSLSDANIHRHRPISVLNVVQDVILDVSFGTQFTIHYDVEEGAEIIGAEMELRSMLHVMLSNAVEASPPGGSIEVTVAKIDNGVSIEVLDEGAGCTDEILQGEFKPHTSTKAEGAGMGLFITQRLAELHYRGKLRLQNVSQGGCKASLTLHNASSEESVNE